MKIIICLLIVLTPFESVFASYIFHLDKKKSQCIWKLYDVNANQDRTYYKTQKCPNQIVWLKDKSFYYSIGTMIYWSKVSLQSPVSVVDYMKSKRGFSPDSEVIWGVKGKYNSVHAMVIDPKIKHMRVNRLDSYEYRGRAVASTSYTRETAEQKAAGVIRRWSKAKRKWITDKVKLVDRFNEDNLDEDLYNMSVLSSRQIIHYNECSEENCESLPSESSRAISQWEDKLKLIDDGIQSIGYLKLEGNKGILFKKIQEETLHPVRPFLLCEDNCEKMTELELPKSFSDSYSMVKKGQHFLVTNEDRGSIGNLYGFSSAKPIKTFKGPMVFWHPF